MAQSASRHTPIAAAATTTTAGLTNRHLGMGSSIRQCGQLDQSRSMGILHSRHGTLAARLDLKTSIVTKFEGTGPFGLLPDTCRAEEKSGLNDRLDARR